MVEYTVTILFYALALSVCKSGEVGVGGGREGVISSKRGANQQPPNTSVKVMGIISEEASLLFYLLFQLGSTLIGKNLLL